MEMMSAFAKKRAMSHVTDPRLPVVGTCSAGGNLEAIHHFMIRAGTTAAGRRFCGSLAWRGVVEQRDGSPDLAPTNSTVHYTIDRL
jgi:hypothetical protein